MGGIPTNILSGAFVVDSIKLEFQQVTNKKRGGFVFLSDGCDYILEQKEVHQVSAIAWSLRGSRHRQSRASSLLWLKTKTKIFDYGNRFRDFTKILV